MFPYNDHNHDACVAEAISAAEAVCATRRARLTLLRRQVLKTLLEKHEVMGAYQIVTLLSEGGRRIAPMAVYRALDFLAEHGLIHRMESERAFIACHCAGGEHMAQFLICRSCGKVGELLDKGIGVALGRASRRAGFTMNQAVVEIKGLCGACRAERSGRTTRGRPARLAEA